MDEIAELGYAAHWKYKTGVHEDETENRHLDEHNQRHPRQPEPNAIDFLDTIKLNLFASEIYVFTPKDLITLPAGATVLDMAFAIHSEVGTHCMAGKINHRLVPLSHRLDSGDRWKSLPRHRKSLRRNGCSSATPLKPRTVCGLF